MAAGYLRQDKSSVLITRVVAGHCYQVVNRRGTENDNLDEGELCIIAVCDHTIHLLQSYWWTARMFQLYCAEEVLLKVILTSRRSNVKREGRYMTPSLWIMYD